jgi:hypothetical protein
MADKSEGALDEQKRHALVGPSRQACGCHAIRLIARCATIASRFVVIYYTMVQ